MIEFLKIKSMLTPSSPSLYLHNTHTDTLMEIEYQKIIIDILALTILLCTYIDIYLNGTIVLRQKKITLLFMECNPYLS